LTQDAKVPDTKPMPTLRKNSCTGSCNHTFAYSHNNLNFTSL
jgi:hypothetical protein